MSAPPSQGPTTPPPCIAIILMLFVSVRRGLNRITGDTELLVAVARRLQEEGRWMGRETLPRDLGRAVKRLKREADRSRGC